jgi:polysaccharide chain length determinant protein (PEP-CTERM system associated)
VSAHFGIWIGDIDMCLKDIRFYYSILLRRMPHFIAIVVAVTIVGVFVVYLLPPVYRANAKILVEAPKISTQLAPSTVPSNAVEQLQIYQEEISTREHLLAIAEKFGVFDGETSELSSADMVKEMRSRTSFELVSDERTNGGATVFNISFDDQNAEIAASVVNEFASLILKKNVRMRTGRASETLRFFADEVARLNGELKSLDSKMLTFTNEHREALPDSLDFRRMQQSALQDKLQMLDWEEAGLRNRRANLVRMYEATGEIAKAGPLTLEQQALQDLKRTLSEQLVLFSENSPNIAALRARIDALEKSPGSSVETKGENAAKKTPSELGLQLSEIDQRMNFIARERASIDKKLEALAKSITDTPNNATVLNALQRSRENVQSQYSAAVQRYAEASISQQIETDAQGERFTLVEPAVPPQDPVWPKRKRLAAAALAAGVAMGIGLIVLYEMFNRRIRRSVELVDALQIQPIATIPFIEHERVPRLAYFRHAAGILMIAGLGQFLWVSSVGGP